MEFGLKGECTIVIFSSNLNLIENMSVASTPDEVNEYSQNALRFVMYYSSVSVSLGTTIKGSVISYA